MLSCVGLMRYDADDVESVHFTAACVVSGGFEMRTAKGCDGGVFDFDDAEVIDLLTFDTR